MMIKLVRLTAWSTLTDFFLTQQLRHLLPPQDLLAQSLWRECMSHPHYDSTKDKAFDGRGNESVGSVGPNSGGDTDRLGELV